MQSEPLCVGGREVGRDERPGRKGFGGFALARLARLAQRPVSPSIASPFEFR